jgi:hypothetical protein
MVDAYTWDDAYSLHKKKDDAYRGDFFFAVQHFSSRAKNLDALNKTTMYATHWSSLLFEL